LIGVVFILLLFFVVTTPPLPETQLGESIYQPVVRRRNRSN
jgi:biopolymer transport protein ExbD